MWEKKLALGSVGDVQLLARDMYNLVLEAILLQAESEDFGREGVERLCSQGRNEGLVVSLDHYGLPQDVIREFLTSLCSCEGLLLDMGVATFCGCHGSGGIGGRSLLQLRHLEQDGTEPVGWMRHQLISWSVHQDHSVREMLVWIIPC